MWDDTSGSITDLSRGTGTTFWEAGYNDTSPRPGHPAGGWFR